MVHWYMISYTTKKSGSQMEMAVEKEKNLVQLDFMEGAEKKTPEAIGNRGNFGTPDETS